MPTLLLIDGTKPFFTIGIVARPPRPTPVDPAAAAKMRTEVRLELDRIVRMIAGMPDDGLFGGGAP